MDCLLLKQEISYFTKNNLTGHIRTHTNTRQEHRKHLLTLSLSVYVYIYVLYMTKI